MASTEDGNREGKNGEGQPSGDSNGNLRRSLDNETSPQTSAFQSAVAAWRNIDLSTLQKSLDTTATDIVSSQKENLVERKELAQKTKEYKKLGDEGKKEEWKGLLKSYQTFIDHLTTSKKATENAFLNLYQSLSEAPDPYPLLEATIDSLLSLSDMQALTRDNTSLNSTVTRLSSQIANLEASMASKNKEIERLKHEKDEDVKKAEDVWRGVIDEKTRNWEGKEKALLDKLEHQEGVLKEIKASYEVSQRMGPRSAGGAEEDGLAKERMAEFEILSRDLERTTLRLAEVEGRNEQLRLELANAQSQEGHTTTSNDNAENEEDPLIARLQGENATLLRRFENINVQAGNEKKEWERKIRGLERAIDGLKKDKDILKEKMAKWGDYEEVRRELEILKSIEFSTGDDEEDGDDFLDFSKTGTADGDESGGRAKGGKETLEQMLLARNKKLGSDLTVLRVSHDELSSRLQNLQQTLDSTTSELVSARSLNEKLENDLLKFQQETQHSSALSVAGTYVSRYPSAQSMAHGSSRRISPTSSIISGVIPHSASHVSLAGLRAGENESYGSGSGILPMVTAQRDRFKQKNQQLEDDLSRAHGTISNLRQEVASLQKDNLQLYEKTRYISSYSRQPVTVGAAGSSSGFGVNPNAASTLRSSDNSGGLSIDRYRQAYEANISPFEAFRGRESARAFHRMGVVERIIYSLTRVVLANRTSRNLFAGYCVLLHLLMFSMLYYAGTAEVEKHLTGMAGDSIAASMAAAAGEAGGLDHGDWHPEGFDGK
ncbi:hypothetical protein P167DRAFT_517127 [Morchella conica CCBAS932]|uniref:Protein CASP n=1 Tax=Morchella conica CCBAS932 TaxID=1392247 RepID=A0A3N4L0M7_9PEZI|nr:hypothetical protein P167DRAFT_517127 [Morchella conica CCBAS932]